MSYWHQIIQTGNPAHDQQLLAAAHQHAAGQGLVLRVTPLAQGGVQVEAVPPGAQAGPYGMAMPNPAPPQQRPMARGGCQACGRHAPTKMVSFSQNIGLLILRIPKTIRGELCGRCIRKYFWEYTLISSFLGWWGVISFFYTAVTIPMNIVTFIGAHGVPDEFPGGAPRR